MSDGTTVAYLYDGTFEGLMTAVFEAFSHRPMPDTIAQAGGFQPQFGQQTRAIATEEAKAARVIAGIRRLGDDIYERLWLAFLSEQIDRGQWIYAYIRLGLAVGPRVRHMLTDDRVVRIHKWSDRVSLEKSRYVQFVRFSQREGGVYYAGIQPQYDVLALLMPHFADRFRIQPFIIHDKVRGLFGVFDTRSWSIVEADGIHLPAVTDKEQEYCRLWKTFYRAVAIKERTNPRCRRQFMPQKYWKEITEMQMDVAREETEMRRSPLPPDTPSLQPPTLPHG